LLRILGARRIAVDGVRLAELPAVFVELMRRVRKKKR
jgi:hypothetical protein